MNFGHHPDPAIDFCVEVEAIEGESIDQRAGLAPQFDVSKRVERAMLFRVGGDQAAVSAKQALREHLKDDKAGGAGVAQTDESTK